MNWKTQIGKRRDVDIARDHGISYQRVRNLRLRLGLPRYAPWDEEPLGLFPDSVIAVALDVHHSAVAAARRNRGIAACPADSYTIVRPNAHDWDDEPLGQITDAELGAKLGVSKQRIHAVRKKRGIPSFTESQEAGGS